MKTMTCFKLSVLTGMFLFLALNTQSQTPTYNHELKLDSDSIFSPYLIALVVVNVEVSADWYKGNLGFQIVQKMDFPEYDSLHIIRMKLGKVELELIQKNNSFSIKKFVPDYNGFSGAALYGFAKIAFKITDAESLAKQLKANNVKFLREISDNKTTGDRSFIIADLDDNVLQFTQPSQIIKRNE